MYSFFFIPASKIDKLEKLRNLAIDEFIIDFEDAIKESERQDLIDRLSQNEALRDCYLRIPVYDNSETNIDLNYLKPFLKSGFKNFVFPKIQSIDDLETLRVLTKSYNISPILLIETPRLYLELLSNISTYVNYFRSVALGSHDFMASVGGVHNLENLETVRQNILYFARATHSQAIDIASMNINDTDAFRLELQDGFRKGFDGKFLIHPRQHKIFDTYQFYTEEEYNSALKIISQLEMVQGNEEEFNPVVIDGQIIERPHLERALKVVKTYKK